MVSPSTEAALELHIGKTLAKNGHAQGDPADFDREFVVDGKFYLISWDAC
jgi:hypothetical protein